MQTGTVYEDYITNLKNISLWTHLWGLPQNFCSTFFTSVKIDRKFLKFFLWLILMSQLPLQQWGTMCFLAHVEGVIKMPWYGDVCFKQWAVTKFLVTEKELVMEVHTLLKKDTASTQLIKAVTCSALWIAGSQKGQVKLSDADHSCQTRTAVTHIDSMCWWTDSKQQMDCKQKACNWALSMQEKCEQHDLCLRIFKSVVVGYDEAWLTITHLCGKRRVLQIFSPGTRLMVKDFLHGLSLCMKHRFITLKCLRSAVQSHESGMASSSFPMEEI